MSTFNDSAISIAKPTLPLSGLRAYLFQISLISAAVVLPLAVHLTGAPVRYILPMHWPVILAGLVYGWRGGAITGFLAPIVSFLISGFPHPVILPSMTVELMAYGVVAGWLIEQQSMKPILATAIALIAGRIVFIVSVFFGSVTTNYPEYFAAAMIPGLAAGIAQMLVLPVIAKAWIAKENSHKK